MNDILALALGELHPGTAAWAAAACWLAWRLFRLNDQVRKVIDRNTEALVGFRTVLDERLPRRGGRS
jgi:hypothetical protein